MNDLVILLLAGLVVGVIALVAWAKYAAAKANRIARAKRAPFITAYRFPAELTRRFREKHPGLTMEQSARVFEGLRQYFLACLAAQTNGIARQCGMPSKAVDDAWHEFIVMTRDYEAFCQGAFGAYLHHTPRLQMEEATKTTVANTLHQLRSPPVGALPWAMAGTVPLLFALDRELGIAGGYHHDEASLAQLDEQRWLLARQHHAAMAGSDSGDSGSWSPTWSGSPDGGGGSSDGGGGSCGGGGCGGGGSS
jgi:hypothetical protein